VFVLHEPTSFKALLCVALVLIGLFLISYNNSFVNDVDAGVYGGLDAGHSASPALVPCETLGNDRRHWRGLGWHFLSCYYDATN
jgi:hypothetical protein